ncbi:hypothetical protein VNO77_43240 [Canavalia gladiata]|uniref:Uncharacterized protein n=1 Tax=Canavalia gladiata TaxID=3824 RepID=A0AAN9JTV0_CANGL
MVAIGCVDGMEKVGSGGGPDWKISATNCLLSSACGEIRGCTVNCVEWRHKKIFLPVKSLSLFLIYVV